MFYVPNDYINDNYTYYFNSEYYVIRTNNNCNENGYCDCYNMYQNDGYLIGNSYQCLELNEEWKLDNNNVIGDYYYRTDMDKILVIFLIIALVGFGIPFYLLKKFMRVV